MKLIVSSPLYRGLVTVCLVAALFDDSLAKRDGYSCLNHFKLPPSCSSIVEYIHCLDGLGMSEEYISKYVSHCLDELVSLLEITGEKRSLQELCVREHITQKLFDIGHMRKVEDVCDAIMGYNRPILCDYGRDYTEILHMTDDEQDAVQRQLAFYSGVDCSDHESNDDGADGTFHHYHLVIGIVTSLVVVFLVFACLLFCFRRRRYSAVRRGNNTARRGALQAGNPNNQNPGTFAPIDLPKPPVYTVSEDSPSAPPSYTSEPPRYEDVAESDRNTEHHQQQHHQQEQQKEQEQQQWQRPNYQREQHHQHQYQNYSYEPEQPHSERCDQDRHQRY